MKFSIEQAAFANALAQVAGIATSRGLEILGHVALSLKGNVLSLRATDLEVYATATAAVDGVHDGAITTEASKLQAVVRSRAGQTITFSVDREGGGDGAEMIRLWSGKSQAKLQALPAADFPEAPSLDGGSKITLSGAALATMLDSVQHAIGSDGAGQPFRTVALLELTKNHFRVVATDGHRMAVNEVAVGSEQGEVSLLLPRKGVLAMARIARSLGDDLSLLVSQERVRLESKHTSITANGAPTPYPDYKKVVPPPDPSPVTVERGALEAALARVALATSAKAGLVAISLEPGKLALTADNVGGGDAGEDSIDVEYTGKPFSRSFNVHYLMDACSSVSSESVVLHFNGPTSPLLVRPVGGNDGDFRIVMPIKS